MSTGQNYISESLIEFPALRVGVYADICVPVSIHKSVGFGTYKVIRNKDFFNPPRKAQI